MSPQLRTFIPQLALFIDILMAAFIWFGRGMLEIDDQIALIICSVLAVSGIVVYIALNKILRKVH